MKNYIGVKIIKADVGTRAEAEIMKTGVSLKIARAMARNDNQTDADVGYIVMYPDGYVSWIPRRVFDETYREIDNCLLSFINNK